MDTLYDKIAATEKFTASKPETLPVVDQSQQAAFALDWASRQQAQTPVEPPKMVPIVPVAN